ncbi:MAG: hypothetical protein ABW195_18545 [Ilumatobacteraceae bacterium]
MASITSWSRIEPAPGDISTGLAARIADPLWLLARQWQVGEFQGEDGGTPIVARWRGDVTAPSRLHLGPIAPDTQLVAPRFDADAVPLETLIERQPVGLPAAATPGPDGLRLGVETGLHFLRLLRAQATAQDYGPAFTRAFAVRALTPDATAHLDPESAGYLQLVAGRALDGRRLRAAWTGNTVPSIGMPIAPGDLAEVRAAGAAWRAWVDDLFSHPDAGDEPTWQRERMEHACSIAFRASPDPFEEWTLTAGRYDGGDLDWYSFDRNGDVNVGTTAAEVGEVVTQTVVPAPVTLRGMPAPRFWELEDAMLDLGALTPGGTDITQLLMIESITGFGNDWYVIGVDLPVGSLTRTRSLVVTDTFGTATLLRPNGHQATTGSSAWQMFQLAMPVEQGSDGVAMTNALFMPPSLVQPLEGPPIEEVLLLRDEQANLAWAVERRLESPLQQAVDAAGDALDASDPVPPADVSRYRLASDVPPHWIPLLPVRLDPDRPDIRLARGAVLDPDASGGSRVVVSTATLLGEPTEPLLIPEEEVPREGVVVRRHFQAARDADGRLFVWLAHRASVGRGEGSSGLRFDTLVD